LRDSLGYTLIPVLVTGIQQKQAPGDTPLEVAVREDLIKVVEGRGIKDGQRDLAAAT
jgi:hypothetical protein